MIRVSHTISLTHFTLLLFSLAGQMADAFTTLVAIHLFKMREMNPIMRPIADKPHIILPLKAFVAAQGFGVPGLMVFSGVFGFAAATWNVLAILHHGKMGGHRSRM